MISSHPYSIHYNKNIFFSHPHRNDHALIFLPGATAAEERDEEDDDAHHYKHQRRTRGSFEDCHVVQRNVNQYPQNYQGQATQLEMRKRKNEVEVNRFLNNVLVIHHSKD